MIEPFDSFYREYDAWYDRNRYAYLSELEAVKKALPREGRGLEIGAGTGRFAAPLRIDIGLDPSEKMLGIARKRGVYAVKGQGEDLPFPDRSFDYIALIVTMCFVNDPAGVLAETHRALRPGGRVILGIIDRESPTGSRYPGKDSIFYRHARLFNTEEITRLLRDSGFGAPSFFQTLFHPPSKLTRKDPVKEGRGEGAFVVAWAEKPA